jgi:hypothetical protein
MNYLSAIILEFKASHNSVKLFSNIMDEYKKNKIEGLSILNYFHVKKDMKTLENIFKKKPAYLVKDMINTANNLNELELKQLDLNYMQIINDLQEI